MRLDQKERLNLRFKIEHYWPAERGKIFDSLAELVPRVAPTLPLSSIANVLERIRAAIDAATSAQTCVSTCLRVLEALEQEPAH